MPTRIELLKQAGFSDGEIGDWATAERQRMRQAGFTDSEIDDEFGVTRPPKQVPAAFIHRILGAAREYAQGYFGDEPLGFSPETQEALRKLGIAGDIIIPAGKPIDAALRTLSAGTAGIGAAVGQAVEEGQEAIFGPGPYGRGKAARDFAQFAQIAAMLLGASGRTPGAARAPAPKAAAADAPVSALPRAEDFRNAASVISGTAASFPTEQKLLRLWNDHGIPPAEVAEDALRDRTIGDAIRSDSDKLPEAYVGTGETTTPTGAEPGATTRPAKPAEAEPATAPMGIKAALVEAGDGSAGNLNASERANMIAEARVRMRHPPARPQRPFSEDYPRRAPTDVNNQLLYDIEGRPLGATSVAGRRFAGKADEALSPEDIRRALAETGINLTDIPRKQWNQFPRGLRGLYWGRDEANGPALDIYLKTGPKAADRDKVIAHEFGHAIDQLSGNISETLTPEEIAELRSVYGNLRYRPKKEGPSPQPEHFGYPPELVNSELVAEGLRAYLTNPNYFKTMAPKAAAKIRAAVNENPWLQHAIQFNSLLAAGLIGAGARGQDRDDQ
ncbi:MAG TPA: hypothetical protein VKT99_01925 [Xanthobacteraceae bacterium]|jgi:hypothetical protein|nr:hypothetical protein [Xanthobacteraceae bacterium]